MITLSSQVMKSECVALFKSAQEKQVEVACVSERCQGDDASRQVWWKARV
jgi:hypothetical protein